MTESSTATSPDATTAVALDVSQGLLTEELGEGLQGVLNGLTTLLDAEAASILLVDRASHQLFFAAATGEKAATVEKLRLGELEGIAGKCVAEGRPIVANDLVAMTAFSPKVDEASGMRTRNIVACPLLHGDVIFGVLEAINKRDGEFTEADRDVASLLANMAALAIWQSRRYARCFSALALDMAEYEAGVPMIGRSPALQAVRDLIPKIARTDTPIMITGESGVGKEVLAKLIWKSGSRSRRVFSAVNCAAIPATLIESELFGHEKGSFTGAHERRLGRFEAADKGTLFLDEIGDLPIEMQSKLLRVLQDMEVTRIGSTKPIKVDVRIIAATNRDLKEAVANKQFREDLYYRLNVIACRLPALRERKDDIIELTRFFIAQFNESMGRAVEGVTSELQARLESYRWPGNIRELRNTIERLMVLGDGNTLDDSQLPDNIA